MRSRQLNQYWRGELAFGELVAWPLLPEVNAALGIKSDVIGLAVAVKPSPETYKRFKSGELTGFSIAGMGERSPLMKRDTDEESLAAAPVEIVAPAEIDPSIAIEQPVVTPPPHVEPSMTTEAAQILDLTAKLAKAERLATLTDAQRAHYGKLGTDGEAYLAKSLADRQAVIVEIAKADEVVYTSTSTGETFRKSDDVRLVTMAKRQDAQAVELAKRDEAIEKAEIATIAKATLGNLGGSDDVHQLIVRSLRKSGAPQTEIDAALTAMKGWHVLAKSAGVAKGTGGSDPQPDSPEAKVEHLAKAIATEQKVDITKARALVFDTAEGIALYGEIEKRKQAARTGVSA